MDLGFRTTRQSLRASLQQKGEKPDATGFN